MFRNFSWHTSSESLFLFFILFFPLPHICFHGWTIKMQTSTKNEQIKFLSQFHKIKPKRHQKKRFSSFHSFLFRTPQQTFPLSQRFIFVYFFNRIIQGMIAFNYSLCVVGWQDKLVNKQKIWDEIFYVFLKNHSFLNFCSYLDMFLPFFKTIFCWK